MAIAFDFSLLAELACMMSTTGAGLQAYCPFSRETFIFTEGVLRTWSEIR
jgi:hypothetical protein